MSASSAAAARVAERTVRRKFRWAVSQFAHALRAFKGIANANLMTVGCVGGEHRGSPRRETCSVGGTADSMSLAPRLWSHLGCSPATASSRPILVVRENSLKRRQVESGGIEETGPCVLHVEHWHLRTVPGREDPVQRKDVRYGCQAPPHGFLHGLGPALVQRHPSNPDAGRPFAPDPFRGPRARTPGRGWPAIEAALIAEV